MTKPKPRQGAKTVKSLFTGIFFAALVLGAGSSPVWAAGSTSSPSPSATPEPLFSIQPVEDPTAVPMPAPTAIGDPPGAIGGTPKPTPPATPSPSTPVVCGVCFNPAAYSLTKANSLWVVANKQRPLNPITYKPALGYFKGVALAKVTSTALTQMAAGMTKDKAGTLLLNSGYRSYDTQKIVHARQVANLGLKAGEALAARPGYSEHQTGLAADVSAFGQGCVIQVCFAKTKAGKWLSANAWQYGFILRYPDGQTKITGYQFEPWHFRFVGVQLATEMKSQNIATLENFWQLPAAPSYTY
jgi:zinc D-Ala-D-Ala carboxypeptidase